METGTEDKMIGYRNIRFRIFHMLMLLVMVTIFCFSAQEGTESSEISNAFLLWLLDLIGSYISRGLSLWITRWIRKLAHFTIYAVLGFFATGMMVERTRNRVSNRVTASLPAAAFGGWLIATGYAATDEFHQLFVPGRSGMFTDVCLDGAGAAFGVVILLVSWLAGRWLHRGGRRPESRSEE